MKKSLGQSNRIKRGTLSVIYTVVFIVLIIALNLVVSSVSGSVNLNIDLSKEDFLSIGEVSRRALDGLGDDLDATIYLLADRDKYDSAGSTYRGLNLQALVRDLCELYSYEYKNIRVEYKDTIRDPEWTEKYEKITNSKLTASNVVIEGKKSQHTRVLTLDSFFTVSSESNTPTGFNGELRLTTALLQCCSDERQVISFTKGHGEPDQLLKKENGTVSPATRLCKLLQDSGFEVLEVNLATEEIDPRTRILIIDDPTNDVTEIDKIDDYMKRQRDKGDEAYNSVIVLVDDQTAQLRDLSDYLANEWGIGFRAKHQLTSEDSYGNNPLNVSAKVPKATADGTNSAAYQITQYLPDAPVIMPRAVELYRTETTTADRFTVETVLQTTERSTSTYVGEDPVKGSFPLVLLSAKSDYVNLKDENSTNQVRKYQYAMLIGSTDFASDGYLDSVGNNNDQVLLSAIRIMAVERYSLNIDYKEIQDVALTIQDNVAFRLGVLICAVLPGIIVIAGMVVFFRRRHL